MAVPPVAASTTLAAQAAAPDVKPQAKSAPQASAPASTQALDSVTISTHARSVAAISGPPSQTAAKLAAPPRVATAQTSTNAYVLKVRAALAGGGNASVQQIMARLGIPQSEQQQILTALGASLAKPSGVTPAK